MAKKKTGKKKNLGHKAIKYRIFPTKEQISFLEQQFGCCRLVYNTYLAFREAEYLAYKYHELCYDVKATEIGEDGKTVKLYETLKKELSTPFSLKEDMYEDYPFLKEMDSIALNQEILRVDEAYKNYYDGLKKGRFHGREGLPKYKNKYKDKPSFSTCRSTLYQSLPNEKGNLSLSEDGIKIPKLKEKIALDMHRKPEDGWILKSATISREAGCYYASLGFEFPVPEIKEVNTDHIGLDYKQSELYIDSNGLSAQMPRFYEKSLKKLEREQQKLSRMQGPDRKNGIEPSNNWKKQNAKVQKLQAHIANQRKYFLHCKSKELCDAYGIISTENLDIKEHSSRDNYTEQKLQTKEHGEVTKKIRYGQRTNDNGWGMFTSFLAYKQAERGHAYIKIDKWAPSSQVCHECGYQNPITKDTTVRKVFCPECGAFYDRDENAAKNIDAWGMEIYESKNCKN